MTPATRSDDPSFPNLEDDRDRAVVDEVDFHGRPEHTGLGPNPRLPEQLCETFEHGFGLLGVSGANKGWATSFANIAHQCELADDQSRTPSFGYRPVHQTVLIRKDPKVGHLVRGPIDIVKGVPRLDSDQEHDAIGD